MLVAILLFAVSSWVLGYEKECESWGLGEWWRYFWGEYWISNEEFVVDGGFRCAGDNCRDWKLRDLSLSPLCDDLWSNINGLVGFYYIRMFCVLVFILLLYIYNKYLIYFNAIIWNNFERRVQ